jgi:hypothetical protein
MRSWPGRVLANMARKQPRLDFTMNYPGADAPGSFLSVPRAGSACPSSKADRVACILLFFQGFRSSFTVRPKCIYGIQLDCSLLYRNSPPQRSGEG